MSIEVLDPTYGDEAEHFTAPARLASLAGATVGIISNGKQNTAPFFDAIEEQLRTTFGVAEVVRVTKSNYSAPADDHIMDEAKRWQALVAGVGD